MKNGLRGFASAYAMILLGLLGITMLALTTLFAEQIRRTHAVPQEAQQRQILPQSRQAQSSERRARDCAPYPLAR